MDSEKVNGETAVFAKLMNEWSAAIVSNDAASIGRFMSDDWVIVSPNGVTTREQFLGVVASGDLTHETFGFEPARARVYQDMAVITGRVKNNGEFRGTAFTVDEWASDVFVKTGVGWLCVYSHITPAAAETC